MNMRVLWPVLAGAALLAGFVLAIMPTSVATGLDSDISCGSAISPSSSQAVQSDFGNAMRDVRNGDSRDGYAQYQRACEQQIFVQRLIAFPITGAGLIGFGYLWLSASRSRAGQPGSERTDRAASGDALTAP